MAEGFLVRKGGGAFQFNSPAIIETAAVRYGSAAVNAGDFVTVNFKSPTMYSNYQIQSAQSSNQNITRIKSVRITDTIQVIFYYDSQNNWYKYQIATLASNKTISYTSPITMSFPSTAPYSGFQWDASLLGNGKIAFGYYESGNNRITIQVYTYNSSTSTLSLDKNINSGSNTAYSPSSSYSFCMVPYESDKLLINYNSYSSAFPVLQTVDTTNSTYGTQFILQTTAAYEQHLSKFPETDNRFFFVYRGMPQSSSYSGMTVVYVNNGVITVGNQYTNTQSYSYFNIGTPISSTKAVNIFHTSTTTSYQILNVIDATISNFSGPNTLISSAYPISNNNHNNSVASVEKGPADNQWFFSFGYYHSSSSSNAYHYVVGYDTTSSFYSNYPDSNSSSYYIYRATHVSLINANNMFIIYNSYNSGSSSYNFTQGKILSNYNFTTLSKTTSKSTIRGVAKTSGLPEELIEIYTNAGNP
jgi:hypothetical protein